jgi:ribosome-associated translation inhibitor RaiA
MTLPVQISFKGMESSDALSTLIREQAERLGRVYERIERVEVTVDAPPGNHRHGRPFHVRIRVHVPGNDVIVDRDPTADDSHDDAQVAVRDAFDAARRRLDTHAERLRHEA